MQNVPAFRVYGLFAVDDGYRLSYSGYDYLALKAFSKKGVIYAVGPQVGTGKESDVFTCTGDDESGKQLILKIHRYCVPNIGLMIVLVG